jgi:COP9 signalosome complex subunit 5
MLNQQYQEPWLAVIIDPIRTCAAGKVEIGAFRTYPEGYKPPEQGPAEYQTIPLAKIEDFGVHADQYYTLDVSFFKSGLDAQMLDLLWNKYWVNTLSSPLVGNRAFVAGQVADLADKLEQADAAAHHGGGGGGMSGSMGRGRRAGGGGAGGGAGGAEDGPLAKVTRDAAVATLEQTKGLSTQVIKHMLFNFAPAGRGDAGGEGASGSGSGAPAIKDVPMAEA